MFPHNVSVINNWNTCHAGREPRGNEEFNLKYPARVRCLHSAHVHFTIITSRQTLLWTVAGCAILANQNKKDELVHCLCSIGSDHLVCPYIRAKWNEGKYFPLKFGLLSVDRIKLSRELSNLSPTSEAEAKGYFYIWDRSNFLEATSVRAPDLFYWDQRIYAWGVFLPQRAAQWTRMCCRGRYHRFRNLIT